MGNDPSGLCVFGSACELRCQLLMMTDRGSAFMVRGPKTAWYRKSFQGVKVTGIIMVCHSDSYVVDRENTNAITHYFNKQD